MTGSRADLQVTEEQQVAVRRNLRRQVQVVTMTLRDILQTANGWTITDRSGQHLLVLHAEEANYVSLPCKGAPPPPTPARARPLPCS